MSQKIVIKAENLSKAYQIGEFSTGTISRDLERWWLTQIRRKEDPFLKIGETNDRSKKGESNIVWSLRDINFEIKQGDAVGIIGKNGAGKSTLLKLLSRVTAPTTGSIKVKGRIASLLEVGTGFHPELTGRENIFLNGAILGMRNHEIKKKLDEIIDFSEVERYIDTPVKRYSSGMYVRLAFAVAAHLESEILIVDEVLAVGDADFQKKCLGKMEGVSKKEGRTVLFVSHNMSSVTQFCDRSILLNKGEVELFNDTSEVIKKYMKAYSYHIDEVNRSMKKNKKLFFYRYFLSDNDGNTKASFTNSERIFLTIFINVSVLMSTCSIVYELINSEGLTIYSSVITDSENFKKFSLDIGNYSFITEIPVNFLFGGQYIIRLRSSIPNIECLDEPEEFLSFELLDLISHVAKTGEGRRGVVILPELSWEKL